MSEQNTPEYYTTKAVSELFQNDEMRQQFMNVYSQSASEAQDYLVEKLQVPEQMAHQIVSKQGEELNKFVGGNICKYLW